MGKIIGSGCIDPIGPLEIEITLLQREMHDEQSALEKIEKAIAEGREHDAGASDPRLTLDLYNSIAAIGFSERTADLKNKILKEVKKRKDREQEHALDR